MLEPTVATDVLLLIHVPPLVASVSVIAIPVQSRVFPEIDAGDGLTVTIVVAVQPETTVNVIVAVPNATPVTVPELITVATDVLLLDHDKGLAEASVNCVVAFAHTEVIPVIAEGAGATVLG